MTQVKVRCFPSPWGALAEAAEAAQIPAPSTGISRQPPSSPPPTCTAFVAEVDGKKELVSS